MNTTQTTPVQVGGDPSDDDLATVASQAYIDEFVAIMTNAINEQNPQPSKINNTTYTENLTTSARRSHGSMRAVEVQPARRILPAGIETEPVHRLPIRQSLQPLQHHHHRHDHRRHTAPTHIGEQIGETSHQGTTDGTPDAIHPYTESDPTRP